MKIRHKTLLALVAGLSGVSMFCVGFASWSFGSGSPTVLGTISAESVKESSEYIEFVDINNFKFDTDGFIDGNNRPVTTDFSVTYNFKPGNVCTFAPQKATITVSLGLSGEGADTVDNFLNSSFISATVTCGGTGKNTTSTAWSSSTSTYDVTFDFDMTSQNSSSDPVAVIVTYTLNFTNLDEYKKYILTPFGGTNGGNLNGVASKLGLKFYASVMDGGAA